MKPFAQLVVFGAGAMGSWLGARAAAPAVLVARGEHARAMRERGLKLGGVSEGIMPVTVADACPLLGPDTLLLVCVKTGDLAVAGEACAPQLAPDTVVAVIANGLAPEAELAAILGRPVVRVVSSFGATMNAPGHVSGWGGRALLAEDEDARRVGALLATTGLKIEHHADLRPVVWEKLAVNCVANPLAGLTGRRNRELVHPDLAGLRRAVVDEVRAVAAAEGIVLPEDLIALQQPQLHGPGRAARPSHRDRGDQRGRGAARCGAGRADAGERVVGGVGPVAGRCSPHIGLIDCRNHDRLPANISIGFQMRVYH
jgi:2-dehydropantoate 2-reductase